MATNILALPELSMPCTIDSNMDWLDSIVFFNAAGNALPLDGIEFHLQVRVSADLPDVLVDASTDNGLLQLLSSGFTASLVTPGSGYNVGDQIFLAGGTPINPAVIAVTAVALIGFGSIVSGVNSANAGTAGSGHIVGEIVQLTGGSFARPANIQIDALDSSGNITAAHIIASSAGFYSVAPNAFSIPPKTGYTSYAVLLSPVYAIAAVRLVDPGIYSVLPPSPATQASSSGTGSGATFNIGQVNNTLGILIPAADLVHPLIEAAGCYQIQAMADGYTQNIASGAMTVTQGIVR